MRYAILVEKFKSVMIYKLQNEKNVRKFYCRSQLNSEKMLLKRILEYL